MHRQVSSSLGQEGTIGFVGKLVLVGIEQDNCEFACRGELQLTSCRWESYLKLTRQARGQYNLANGSLLPLAGRVEVEEHTQIVSRTCTLTGRTSIDGQREQSLYRPSVRF